MALPLLLGAPPSPPPSSCRKKGGSPLLDARRPTRGGLIPLAGAAAAAGRRGVAAQGGRPWEIVRGLAVCTRASVRPALPTSGAPHHHAAQRGGQQGGPTASWEEIQDEEDHRSSQVALLALVPIGLMSLKWAVSTGPVALAIPLVLLAFPIAGSGLRQLLAEGVSMAVRCTTWMQSHQQPRQQLQQQQQQQQAFSADHTHGNHHHMHHNGSSGSGSNVAAASASGTLRRSPGAPAAVPGYGWSASAISPPAHHTHGAAAMQHQPAPAMPTTTASGQRQPVGAWGDVTLAVPTSRAPVPAAAACAASWQQQQQYPGAVPAAAAPAPTLSQHPHQQQVAHTAGVAGLAAPSRQPLPPTVADHHHHRSSHHVPHAAPAHHVVAAATVALPHQHAPQAQPHGPPVVAAMAAHAPPTARSFNLPPPSTLQQLADVQQCEDIDWEVDVRKQRQQHNASCPGAGAGAPAMAATAGTAAASERAGSPAVMGVPHHAPSSNGGGHSHNHGAHSMVHRHPPQGPPASPRAQQWP